MSAGTIALFAGNDGAAPAGWFYCTGGAISRTQYPDLFAAISTYYGAGDGSTTFNLPNLNGYVMRGFDDGRGVDPGRVVGTQQAQSMSTHKHAGGAGIMGGQCSYKLNSWPFGNSPDTGAQNYQGGCGGNPSSQVVLLTGPPNTIGGGSVRAIRLNYIILAFNP